MDDADWFARGVPHIYDVVVAVSIEGESTAFVPTVMTRVEHEVAIFEVEGVVSISTQDAKAHIGLILIIFGEVGSSWIRGIIIIVAILITDVCDNIPRR